MKNKVLTIEEVKEHIYISLAKILVYNYQNLYFGDGSKVVNLFIKKLKKIGIHVEERAPLIDIRIENNLTINLERNTISVWDEDEAWVEV